MAAESVHHPCFGAQGFTGTSGMTHGDARGDGPPRSVPSGAGPEGQARGVARTRAGSASWRSALRRHVADVVLALALVLELDVVVPAAVLAVVEAPRPDELWHVAGRLERSAWLRRGIRKRFATIEPTNRAATRHTTAIPAMTTAYSPIVCPDSHVCLPRATAPQYGPEPTAAKQRLDRRSQRSQECAVSNTRIARSGRLHSAPRAAHESARRTRKAVPRSLERL